VYPDGKVYRNRFICLPWPRKTGKTMTCALLPASMLIAYPAPIWIGCYGPNDDAAMRLVAMAKSFINGSPAKLKRFINQKTLSNHVIEFSESGNKMEAFNSSEKEIRGPDIDFAFIDETDQFEKARLIEGAIVPATRNKYRPEVGHGIIFALSTPNMENKNSTFRKWVNRAIEEMALYCRSCRSSFRIEEFETETLTRRQFTPFSPLPATCRPCPNCGKSDWDYIFKYYAVIPPSKISLYSDEQVKIELEQAGNSKLAEQEYLGVFHADSGGIFTEDMLAQLVDRGLYNVFNPPERSWQDDIYRVSAMDIGLLRDNTVFCTVDQDNRTGEKRLLNMEVLEAGHGLNWDRVEKDTLAYIAKFQPDMFVPDATGSGDPFCERIARAIADDRKMSTTIWSNKDNHFGFVFDKRSKKELVDNLELVVKTKGLKIPPFFERGVREMVNEIIDFGYEFTDKNNIVFNGIEGHDDRVMALGLALIGIKNRRFPRGMGLKCV